MKKFILPIITVILILTIALAGCGGGGSYPKCFAYVANRGSGDVSAYSIHPTTGKLTFIGVLGAGTSPYSLTTDPASNYVYVVNHDSQNISIFSINAVNGKLTEISDSPVAAVAHPGFMTINPNTISAYQHAYVANTDSALLTAYSTQFYNNTGKLTYLDWIDQIKPISCNNSSWAIIADPTGRFIYAANRDSNCISGFTINVNDATLEPIPGSPFSTGGSPCSITIDPAGKFVYVANRGSDNVSAYSIDGSGADATGALISIGSIGAGHNPVSITVDPAGKFVYAVNSNSNSISAYSITTTSGGLKEISGSPFNVGSENGVPFAVSVEPTGRFLYVVNNYSGNVQAFAINSKTGVLKPVGTPAAAGQWPVSIITVQK